MYFLLCGKHETIVKKTQEFVGLSLRLKKYGNPWKG